MNIEVIEPEVIEPEVIEPEVIEPEVIEPEVIEPEVIEPEVIEPIGSGLSSIDNNPEIQTALSQASNFVSLINEAKTNTKKDLYKRKLKKIQKKIQAMLYTQYFQNKSLDTN